MYDQKHGKVASDGDEIRDFEKTDLKIAMDCFEKTFMQPMWSSIRCVCTFIVLCCATLFFDKFAYSFRRGFRQQYEVDSSLRGEF